MSSGKTTCLPQSSGCGENPRAPEAQRDTAGKMWRAETVIFLFLWLLLMAGGRSTLFGDPGSLWHIVVGQHILASGELPHADSFTFTFAGQPWIAQWWLGECVLALLHKIGGLDTVLLATATLLAGLYTWVASRLMRTGIHPLLSVLITMLAMGATSYHFHPRPHLLTIVLLGWTFSRLIDFEAGRIPLRRLFWLVPLFILWTNVHGGMMGGVVTLALAGAGWGIARCLGLKTPLTGYRQLLVLIGLTVAAALTALINPYGREMPKVWLALQGSPLLPQLMEEHAPLTQSGLSAIPVLVFGLLYVAALVGTWPMRPRITWLIPLVWFALACTRIRHGPLFAITDVLALAEMFPYIRWVSWLAEKGSVVCRLRKLVDGISRPDLGWRTAVVPIAVVLAVGMLQWAAIPAPLVGRGWAVPDRRSFPLELLPELRACAAAQGKETRIFSDMVYGGFLIYYCPEMRIFIDDRCELYGDHWLAQFAEAAWHHPERLEQWADQYGFALALVQAGAGFDDYLRTAPGWTEVGRTDTAALYRRASAAPDGPAPQTTRFAALPRV